jgi:succinate dehydrogenase / fumarate reductase membrane anchor subunit
VSRYGKSPVGAHYAVGDWLLQRLTAAVMAAYTLLALAVAWWKAPATYADWRALFSGSLVRVCTMVFMVALLYHAWVGMRDILMDYVKPAVLRFALEAAVGVTLVGYLVWSASILWGR